jgi:NAD(P)-dependent dehydrogenase (short-subunit alcohol dehydrogenase family)
MKRLENKMAIVTGGALGIGLAACHALAAEGARVAVTDINDEQGQAAVSEIKAKGGKAQYWHLDVSKEDEVETVFRDVAKAFGGLNVLVNNAGISGADKPTHTLTLEEWELVMRINVTGVFLCTKHAIAHLRQSGGGSIVNLSSIYGLVSAPDLPPYHASKGAVRMMSKTDALLYANDRIRVNSVHPGFIWTPLVAELAQRSQEGPEAFRKNLDQLHPLGHTGEPMDIAWGIVYLASDEAKFVTGTELVIDGGYTAR